MGELADAEYQPGRRLLGAYSFVGDRPAVALDVARHPGYAICPAIVERCDLDTNLSPDGQSQTQARFKLRTKGLYLRIQLPANAELWSAELNGAPLKPQREGRDVLIDVPAGEADAAQDLQFIYAAPVEAFASLRGQVHLPAPWLLLRGEADAESEVPLADLAWRLHLPSGYEVVRADGTVAADEIRRPTPAAFQLFTALSEENGLLSSVQCARESARRAACNNQLGLAVHNYDQTLAASDSEPITYSDGREVKGFYAPSRRLQDPASAAKREDGIRPSVPVACEPPIAYPDKTAWKDMAGARSLKIDLLQTADQDENVTAFHSLGVAPELTVTLASRPQWSAIGWAAALAVVWLGLCIARKTVRTKIAFLLVAAAAATLAPLAIDSLEAVLVCDRMFYAVCALAVFYPAVGLLRWLARRCCPGCCHRAAKPSATVAAVLIAILAIGSVGIAKAETEANADTENAKPQPAVDVPDDAIILPYDAGSRNGVKRADKLLIPYDQYVELWNRAHPDKRIEARPSPARYATAGATYQTRLDGDDSLTLTGQMEIDVFADGFLEIPLELGGCVLSLARLDDRPARLGVPRALPQAPPGSPVSQSPPQTISQQAPPLAASQQAVPQPAAAAETSLLLLHVSGRGRHKLELVVHLKLSRQGGWRVADGLLPSAPATSLTLVVPRPHTEIRLTQNTDRRNHETQQADETVQTALDPGGRLQLRWRPAATATQVDRSLSAVSNALLDIREDGLRLAWQLARRVSTRPARAVQRRAAGRLSFAESRGRQHSRLGNPQNRSRPDRRGGAVAAGQGPRAIHAAALAGLWKLWCGRPACASSRDGCITTSSRDGCTWK